MLLLPSILGWYSGGLYSFPKPSEQAGVIIDIWEFQFALQFLKPLVSVHSNIRAIALAPPVPFPPTRLVATFSQGAELCRATELVNSPNSETLNDSRRARSRTVCAHPKVKTKENLLQLLERDGPTKITDS